MRFSLASCLAVSAAAFWGGCVRAVSEIREPRTGSLSEQAGVGPESSPPQSERSDCLLVVDGTVHVEGQCDVYPLGQGTYTLNTWSDGKPEQSHFAQVTALADGRFEATWNADPDDARAWDKLGEVTLREGCCVNDRVRICAR